MLISVDTEFLCRNKLTPNQFIIIQLILEDKERILTKMVNATPSLENDLFDLSQKNIIKKVGRGNAYTLCENALATFKKVDLFTDFLDVFPTYTTRPNGIKEYLKIDLKRSKAKYDKIVEGRIDVHEHIIKCLATEVKHKTATGGMPYFKRLFNWLNAEGWREFELQMQGLPVESTDLTDGYGTDVE